MRSCRRGRRQGRRRGSCRGRGSWRGATVLDAAERRITLPVVSGATKMRVRQRLSHGERQSGKSQREAASDHRASFMVRQARGQSPVSTSPRRDQHGAHEVRCPGRPSHDAFRAMTGCVCVSRSGARPLAQCHASLCHASRKARRSGAAPHAWRKPAPNAISLYTWACACRTASKARNPSGSRSRAKPVAQSARPSAPSPHSSSASHAACMNSQTSLESGRSDGGSG